MDESLIEAVHANRLLAARRVGEISAASRIEQVGPWLLINTGEPSFSNANSATPLGEVTAADVQLAVDWFRARNAPFHFVVRADVLSELHADATLRAELERRGYVAAPGELTMTLAASQPEQIAGALSVREVWTDADIDAYAGVNWRPELHHIGVGIARTARRLGFAMLIGELEGRAVAGAMAVVSDRLVGIYNVGVPEAYRRRGFGTAITRAAVEAGYARGATSAWLGASDMARGMYGRMGFVPHYEYRHMTPGR